MTGRAWRMVVPGYAAAVLVLGGASAAGFAANHALQLIGVVLIALQLARGPALPVTPALRRVGWALAVLAVVQFVPLPPGVWAHLPGRERVAAGFDLIGMARPWLMLSLAPWQSLASLTWGIPALTLFLLARGRDGGAIIPVVLAVALGSVLFGLVQQFGAGPYPYAITNYGLGPGLFANSNHQSCLALIALALGAGWVARQPPRRSLRMAAGAGALVLVAGVLANRSLACIALLPVEAVALLALFRPDWRRAVLVALVVLGPLALGFALWGPIANDLTLRGAEPGISRHEFLINSLPILRDFAPFGTGLGSFPEIYRWYENPALAGPTFVNHAHDDLLELLIETGVFGIVVLLALADWVRRGVAAVWRGRDPLAQGATIALGLVMMHSLVDYPLRTAALSGLCALCCAMIDRAEA